MWSFIICIPHKVKENEISGTWSTHGDECIQYFSRKTFKGRCHLGDGV